MPRQRDERAMMAADLRASHGRRVTPKQAVEIQGRLVGRVRLTLALSSIYRVKCVG